MKVISEVILIGLIVVGVSGCQSAAQKRIATLQKNSNTKYNYALSMIQTNAAMSDDQKNHAKALLNERKTAVEDMEKQMVLNHDAYVKELEQVVGRANKYGGEKVWLGRAGLASGIAAGALIVANPANAVWVAALTGFAGGVAGFSAVSESEGYSKVLLIRNASEINAKVANAYTNFTTATLWEMALTNERDQVKWETEWSKQHQRVAIVKTAIDELLVGPIADQAANNALLNELKEQNKKLIDLLAQSKSGSGASNTPPAAPAPAGGGTNSNPPGK
ncbi:MAG: hypothetical protein HY300_15315 [Verrucomicrobia bacterium]|nr:hypothetical protein [Verrucomicrobiota bacterium]